MTDTTTTAHAPHCDRPGYDVERYPHVWVKRCRCCHAVELAEPDPAPSPDPDPGEAQ